jgi:hypothetical protein
MKLRIAVGQPTKLEAYDNSFAMQLHNCVPIRTGERGPQTL